MQNQLEHDSRCDHFYSDDPYDVYALLITFFMCDCCGTRLPQELLSISGKCCTCDYRRLGQLARREGWLVDTSLNCHCPDCRPGSEHSAKPAKETRK